MVVIVQNVSNKKFLINSFITVCLVLCIAVFFSLVLGLLFGISWKDLLSNSSNVTSFSSSLVSGMVSEKTGPGTARTVIRSIILIAIGIISFQIYRLIVWGVAVWLGRVLGEHSARQRTHHMTGKIVVDEEVRNLAPGSSSISAASNAFIPSRINAIYHMSYIKDYAALSLSLGTMYLIMPRLFATDQAHTKKSLSRVFAFVTPVVARGLTWTEIVIAIACETSFFISLEKWLMTNLRGAFEARNRQRLEQAKFRVACIEKMYRSALLTRIHGGSVGGGMTSGTNSPALTTETSRIRRLSTVEESQQQPTSMSGPTTTTTLSTPTPVSIARVIFDHVTDLQQPSSGTVIKTISSTDLTRYFDPPRCGPIFNSICPGYQACSLIDWTECIKEAYRVRKSIQTSLFDGYDLLARVDLILLLIFLSGVLMWWIGNLWPEQSKKVGKQVVALSGAFTLVLGFSLVVLFDGVINDCLRALTFVLLATPYDIGDSVNMDGVHLRVLTINFFSSTFVREDTGTVMYKKNLAICDKQVGNQTATQWAIDSEKRTGKVIRSLVLEYGKGCSGIQLDALKKALVDRLVKADNHFTGIVILKPSKHTLSNDEASVMSNRKFFTLKTEALYRGDQDRTKRNLQFEQFLKESLAACSIECFQAY